MARRRHGFHAPFEPLQILSWVIFPAIIAGYFALALPSLPLTDGDRPWVVLLLTALYMISVSLSLTFAWRTAISDPVDEVSLGGVAASAALGSSGSGDLLFCSLCKERQEAAAANPPRPWSVPPSHAPARPPPSCLPAACARQASTAACATSAWTASTTTASG